MLAGVPDRRALLAALGLGVATLVCFWGVRENAFVNYDDPLYLTDSPVGYSSLPTPLGGNGVVFSADVELLF